MRSNEFIVEHTLAGPTSTRYYRKGNKAFGVDLLINDKEIGLFNYDSTNGRSTVELMPAYRNKGYGKLLILAGVYRANQRKLPYYEDESTTAEFDRAFTSLVDANYILVDEDTQECFVSDSGYEFLTQQVGKLR